MRTLSPRQCEVFRQAARARFAQDMRAHARTFSPRLCATLDDAQLGLAIDGALDQAIRRGFRQRGPARLFVELTLRFGYAFASDPQYPWAQAILEDPGGASPMSRAEALHAKALDYLDQVVGPGQAFARAALENLAVFARSLTPQIGQRFLSEPEPALHFLYPEKAAYLGPRALRGLFEEAMAEAGRHGLENERGRVLICLLCFGFGHGCLDDPLYPWMGASLRDPRILDPPSRGTRLEKKARAWLDQVMAADQAEKGVKTGHLRPTPPNARAEETRALDEIIASWPRAIHATREAAARAALEEANPVSIAGNTEYGGLIYRDQATGYYGHTPPKAGTGTGFDLASVSAPAGSRMVGEYATHGDYSTADAEGRPVRTADPARDHYDSDRFSLHSLRGIDRDAAGHPDYRAYLATPGGAFQQYDPHSHRLSDLEAEGAPRSENPLPRPVPAIDPAALRAFEAEMAMRRIDLRQCELDFFATEDLFVVTTSGNQKPPRLRGSQPGVPDHTVEIRRTDHGVRAVFIAR